MARRGRQMVLDFDHQPVTQETVDDLVAEMMQVYLRDTRPWVIGFSGGKDSTAVVQLVYRMLLALPESLRRKPVWVISSDTLVENPRVTAWMERCQAELRAVAEDKGLPVQVVTVRPDPRQSFWVCLIGKGYPAPTRDFRWCTGRLKIDPAEAFVVANIEPTGRILQLLGSRKAESRSRAASIEAHALEGKFGVTGSLTNGLSYQPIMDWDNDNAWEYLRLFPPPWDRPDDVVQIPDPVTGELVPHYNNELFALYQDGHGGECVLEFDRRTASCGGSRFGCWTCTVVVEDRSLTNMVEMTNPELAPLLRFRQKILDYRNDPSKRDPIGRNGRIRINNYARRAAAEAYAQGDEALRAAWLRGARHAEVQHRRSYTPADGDADIYYPDDPALQEAFQAGARWSLAILNNPGEADEVSRGPYLLEVRAELLQDLFEIERAIPGFRTVTYEDLRWIRHHWEQDGGDPGLVDRLVLRYRGQVA
ncbi:MAG: DNA phosphorothioation system sulfurtransferase DndC [Bacillota bacterium]